MKKSIHKVLFVEDDKMIHLLFEKSIREFDIKHQFIMTFSVEEAIHVIEKEQIDVIISDFYLDDGTAFDVMEKASHIPVIISTGSGNADLAVTSIKLGVFDYVQKELNNDFFQVLFEKIENAISYGKYEIQLKQFIEIAGDIILGIDRENKISYINQKGCSLLNYRKDEMIGQSFFGKVAISSDENSLKDRFLKLFNIYDNVQNKINEDIEDSFETTVLNSKNIKIPILWKCSPYYNKQQKIVGLLLVGENISKIKEMEKLKDEFINIVTHEIRNPIHSIKGFTELILTRDLEKDKRTQYLTIIQNELTRLEDLTSSLLDVQRMDRGTEGFKFRNIDLQELLEEVYLCYKEGENKNVKLDIQAKNIIIYGDYDKLKQVIINLLSNAFKYSPEDSEVELSLTVDKETVYIDVLDHGFGIPEQLLPNICEKFFRVDSPNHNKKTGNGLGLAICKGIVERHKGRIIVESIYGKGSKFRILLPLETSK